MREWIQLLKRVTTNLHSCNKEHRIEIIVAYKLRKRIALSLSVPKINEYANEVDLLTTSSNAE